MDEAAQQKPGRAADVCSLPVMEQNWALVFLPRSVLGKEARPALRVRGYLDRIVGPRLTKDPVTGGHRSDGRPALGDDGRVLRIERDA
jgi:hypothetical protein